MFLKIDIPFNHTIITRINYLSKYYEKADERNVKGTLGPPTGSTTVITSHILYSSIV